MKRILASVLVVSTAAFVVFGCGGTGNANGVNLQRRQLLGLWRDTQLNANGRTVGCPGSIEILSSGRIVSCGGTIEFRSDSTFTQAIDTFGGSQVIREGTWTLMRNQITLFYTGAANPVANDQFTILMGEDGNSFLSEREMDGTTVGTLLVRQTL
ncbi:MAG TPA: hypothetical protein PLL78_08620 [Fimbriimonadaceae bacterium]|nr:hypothetical protein [Fimbriimonadaceae bacterium]HRJ96740.1 hypothetical protein [Fimbriimonadaceae bacterium]